MGAWIVYALASLLIYLKLGDLMTLAEAMAATLKQMKESLANVAADVARLKVKPGMTVEEAAMVQAQLDSFAADVKDLADSTPDPPVA